MKGWSKVFASANEIKAELVKNELKSNEIEAVVVNKQSTSYLLGYFEVYVMSNNAHTAKVVVDLFNQHESEEETN